MGVSGRGSSGDLVQSWKESGSTVGTGAQHGESDHCHHNAHGNTAKSHISHHTRYHNRRQSP